MDPIKQAASSSMPNLLGNATQTLVNSFPNKPYMSSPNPIYNNPIIYSGTARGLMSSSNPAYNTNVNLPGITQTNITTPSTPMSQPAIQSSYQQQLQNVFNKAQTSQPILTTAYNVLGTAANYPMLLTLENQPLTQQTQQQLLGGTNQPGLTNALSKEFSILNPITRYKAFTEGQTINSNLPGYNKVITQVNPLVTQQNNLIGQQKDIASQVKTSNQNIETVSKLYQTGQLNTPQYNQVYNDYINKFNSLNSNFENLDKQVQEKQTQINNLQTGSSSFQTISQLQKQGGDISTISSKIGSSKASELQKGLVTGLSAGVEVGSFFTPFRYVQSPYFVTTGAKDISQGNYLSGAGNIAGGLLLAAPEIKSAISPLTSSLASNIPEGVSSVLSSAPVRILGKTSLIGGTVSLGSAYVGNSALQTYQTSGSLGASVGAGVGTAAGLIGGSLASGFFNPEQVKARTEAAQFEAEPLKISGSRNIIEDTGVGIDILIGEKTLPSGLKYVSYLEQPFQSNEPGTRINLFGGSGYSERIEPPSRIGFGLTPTSQEWTFVGKTFKTTGQVNILPSTPELVSPSIFGETGIPNYLFTEPVITREQIPATASYGTINLTPKQELSGNILTGYKIKSNVENFLSPYSVDFLKIQPSERINLFTSELPKSKQIPTTDYFAGLSKERVEPGTPESSEFTFKRNIPIIEYTKGEAVKGLFGEELLPAEYTEKAAGFTPSEGTYKGYTFVTKDLPKGFKDQVIGHEQGHIYTMNEINKNPKVSLARAYTYLIFQYDGKIPDLYRDANGKIIPDLIKEEYLADLNSGKVSDYVLKLESTAPPQPVTYLDIIGGKTKAVIPKTLQTEPYSFFKPTTDEGLLGMNTKELKTFGSSTFTATPEPTALRIKNINELGSVKVNIIKSNDIRDISTRDISEFSINKPLTKAQINNLPEAERLIELENLKQAKQEAASQRLTQPQKQFQTFDVSYSKAVLESMQKDLIPKSSFITPFVSPKISTTTEILTPISQTKQKQNLNQPVSEILTTKQKQKQVDYLGSGSSEISINNLKQTPFLSPAQPQTLNQNQQQTEVQTQKQIQKQIQAPFISMQIESRPYYKLGFGGSAGSRKRVSKKRKVNNRLYQAEIRRRRKWQPIGTPTSSFYEASVSGSRGVFGTLAASERVREVGTDRLLRPIAVNPALRSSKREPFVLIQSKYRSPFATGRISSPGEKREISLLRRSSPKSNKRRIKFF